MVSEFSYYIDLSDVKFADDQRTTWLHAMPLQEKVSHPFYGEMDFGESALTAYANSVLMRVLGTVDPVIDFDHMMFNGRAAGWVKSAKVQKDGAAGDGLQLFVEWTDEAVRLIKNKQYRYFSPTFTTKWIDQHGKEHRNVIFGGGLTNRPFLKNLVPINLSELSFGLPTNPPPQEVEVDLNKLREILGLAADTPEAEVYKVFGERLQPTTPPTPPTNVPPAPPAPPAPTPAPQLTLSEGLRQLAESHPLVKDLIAGFEGQIRQTSELTKQLREQEIAVKLGELDRSDLILTPASKDLIHDVVVGMSDEVAVKFWELMHHMMNTNAFVVELGERAKAGTRYSRDKSAAQTVNELKDKYVAEGMSLADAYERIGRENPGLYDAYREESFSFKA